MTLLTISKSAASSSVSVFPAQLGFGGIDFEEARFSLVLSVTGSDVAGG